MTDNIHVERTEKELVAEVYPADKPYRDLADKKDMKRGKKYYEAEMQRLAILAAQAYRNRWQIERSFETVKQEFSLEKLRVRTFRRLRNVFSLCVVAYLSVNAASARRRASRGS